MKREPLELPAKQEALAEKGYGRMLWDAFHPVSA